MAGPQIGMDPLADLFALQQLGQKVGPNSGLYHNFQQMLETQYGSLDRFNQAVLTRQQMTGMGSGGVAPAPVPLPGEFQERPDTGGYVPVPQATPFASPWAEQADATRDANQKAFLDSVSENFGGLPIPRTKEDLFAITRQIGPALSGVDDWLGDQFRRGQEMVAPYIEEGLKAAEELADPVAGEQASKDLIGDLAGRTSRLVRDTLGLGPDPADAEEATPPHSTFEGEPVFGLSGLEPAPGDGRFMGSEALSGAAPPAPAKGTGTGIAQLPALVTPPEAFGNPQELDDGFAAIQQTMQAALAGADQENDATTKAILDAYKTLEAPDDTKEFDPPHWAMPVLMAGLSILASDKGGFQALGEGGIHGLKTFMEQEAARKKEAAVKRAEAREMTKDKIGLLQQQQQLERLDKGLALQAAGVGTDMLKVQAETELARQGLSLKQAELAVDRAYKQESLRLQAQNINKAPDKVQILDNLIQRYGKEKGEAMFLAVEGPARSSGLSLAERAAESILPYIDPKDEKGRQILDNIKGGAAYMKGLPSATGGGTMPPGVRVWDPTKNDFAQ